MCASLPVARVGVLVGRARVRAWVCACVLASKVKGGEEVGHHDLAIALRLGFLAGLKPMFRLERDSYFYL